MRQTYSISQLHCNTSILYRVLLTSAELHPCSLDVAELCRPMNTRKDREVSQQCASSTEVCCTNGGDTAEDGHAPEVLFLPKTLHSKYICRKLCHPRNYQNSPFIESTGGGGGGVTNQREMNLQHTQPQRSVALFPLGREKKGQTTNDKLALGIFIACHLSTRGQS